MYLYYWNRAVWVYHSRQSRSRRRKHRRSTGKTTDGINYRRPRSQIKWSHNDTAMSSDSDALPLSPPPLVRTLSVLPEGAVSFSPDNARIIIASPDNARGETMTTSQEAVTEVPPPTKR